MRNFGDVERSIIEREGLTVEEVDHLLDLYQTQNLDTVVAAAKILRGGRPRPEDLDFSSVNAPRT
jgi:hypothetical protein